MTNETSAHYQRVRAFMEGCKQVVFDKPTAPSPELAVSRARMLLEEVLELCRDGLGLSINVPTDRGFVDITTDPKMPFWLFRPVKPIDLVETADGLADISVINSGTMIACGIKDMPLLEVVDNNNLLKLERGRLNEHGKLVKPPDHPAPDIAGALKAQGWEGQDVTAA